jgi:hypothetical protein
MRNIENVVDFADICMFAEQEKIAHYNAAHSILDKDFYPSSDMGPTFELYKSEVSQYTDDAQAIEILTKFMESKNVTFINITA